MKPVLIAALASLALATPNLADAAGKSGKHCPPGLAKKTPACVPPGLAKKGVTADEGIETYDELASGDRIRIDGEDYVVIRRGDRIILRRADGQLYPLSGTPESYGRVRDALVTVDRKAQAVFEIFELTDVILN